MTHVLFLGLGYCARAIAGRLAARGWQVTGTARTEAGAASLASDGWRGLVLDGSAASRELCDALQSATHLVSSVPPTATGDPCLALHAGDLAAAPRLRWIGYLSSVGVYGNHDGGWVDETTPCRPEPERGARRLAAETAWLGLAAATGRHATVFRLPGIYGPGRSAIDALRAGTARRIVKPGHVFNRIHVGDIAGAVERVLHVEQPPSLLNVADDEPAPADEVVVHAARLLSLPPPPPVPFEAAALSPMALSFYRQSKRVSNRRLRETLGYQLLYPSYREGLAAILAAERESRA